MYFVNLINQSVDILLLINYCIRFSYITIMKKKLILPKKKTGPNI
jgi:hypothetical protein